MTYQRPTAEQWAAQTWAEPAFGEAIDPTWYILYAPPRVRAAEKLQAKLQRDYGVHSFFPTADRWRKQGRGHDRKRVKVSLPVLGSLVFAEFTHRPRWHILKGQRIISDVVQRGNEPAALTPHDMDEITGFREVARAQKAKLVSVGDMVEVRRGAFLNWSASVKEVKDSLLLLDIQLLGKPIWVDAADVEVG